MYYCAWTCVSFMVVVVFLCTAYVSGVNYGTLENTYKCIASYHCVIHSEGS